MPLLHDTDRPLSEKEWKARDDARILATANRITSDKPRLERAKQAAQSMVDEERKDISAMSAVARKSSGNRVGGAGPKRRTPTKSNPMNVFRKI